MEPVIAFWTLVWFRALYRLCRAHGVRAKWRGRWSTEGGTGIVGARSGSIWKAEYASTSKDWSRKIFCWDSMMVAYEEVFQTVKCPAFMPRLYNPCRVVRVGTQVVMWCLAWNADCERLFTHAGFLYTTILVFPSMTIRIKLQWLWSS